MSKVNELGIDVFGFGTETVEYDFAPEFQTEEGIESVDEIALMDDIIDLCEANESLDTQYAVGLVNGLECIHNTYQMILMSSAMNTMDSGNESADLGTILSAAGIDCCEFDGGTEARQGGAVQPLRNAKNWVTGSKAYKAVADSFVGKGTKSVVDKIKKFLNWLKELIFGKAQKQIDQTQQQIKSLSGKVAEYERVNDDLKKQAKTWKSKFQNVLDENKTLKSKADRSDAWKLKAEELEMSRDNLDAAYKEQQQISDEAFDAMVASMNAKIEAEKRATAAANALVTKLRTELKDQADANAMHKDNLAINFQGEIDALTERIIQLEAVAPVANDAIKLSAKFIDFASNKQAATMSKVTSESVKTEKAYMSTVQQLRQAINSKGGARAFVLAANKNNFGKNGKYGVKVGNTLYNSTPGFKRNLSKARHTMADNIINKATKRNGSESEDFDLSSVFLMDGTESEMFDFGYDFDEAMETPHIDIALAKLDMLLATEAGVEAMTMEHFGHEYIGIDVTNGVVYGITPGMEAENLAATADKKEQAQGDWGKSTEKKEEGFKGALSRFGRGVKNTPGWIMKQVRKFIKYLMSKSVILDRMFSKLSGLFSRNVNVKDIFTGEKKDTVAKMVINLVYGIKKASYDLDKLVNKESKAEEPNIETITKDINEKFSKLEKVNTGNLNSALDKLGLADAAKELRVLKGKLSKGSLEKMVKKETINEATSKELATTMATLNAGSQKLAIFVKSIISDARIAANKEKESKEEKKEEK